MMMMMLLRMMAILVVMMVVDNDDGEDGDTATAANIMMISNVKYNHTHTTPSTTSNIRRTKFQNFLVSSCSCLCPIHSSQVLSRDWRCCWSSADNIWVINNFIAY